MFGLQPLHWLIIILVGILFFAPGRLPQVVRSVKKMVSEFKSAQGEDRPDEGEGSASRRD